MADEAVANVALTEDERVAILEGTEGIVDGSEAIGYDQPWVHALKSARHKIISTFPPSGSV